MCIIQNILSCINNNKLEEETEENIKNIIKEALNASSPIETWKILSQLMIHLDAWDNFNDMIVNETEENFNAMIVNAMIVNDMTIVNDMVNDMTGGTFVVNYMNDMIVNDDMIMTDGTTVSVSYKELMSMMKNWSNKYQDDENRLSHEEERREKNLSFEYDELDIGM